MKKTTLLFTFLLISQLAFSQNSPKRLLIEQVNIIPMHINTVLENRDVIIEDGKIVRVQEHIENDTMVYDLGKIDGSNKYLLPAFTDAHVHLPEQADVEHFFLLNLASGVTTLRSMRGEDWHLEIDQNKPFTPHLMLAAPPIRSRDSLLTPTLVKQNIATYKAQGFDFVKILSVKDEAIFNSVVEACKANDFKAAGHCPMNIGIFNVAESGVFRSVEHLRELFRLPDVKTITRAIDTAIAADIYPFATLDWNYTGFTETEELRHRAGVQFIPKAQIKEWEQEIKDYESKVGVEKLENERDNRRKYFDVRLNYLSYIYRQGGNLLIGVDASHAYSVTGYALLSEMKHHQDAGVSNYDILKASCYNLAEMLGENQTWGTIKNGMTSDLVLLNGNPLENLEAVQNIEGIVFKGNYYTKKALETKLKKAMK